MDDICIHLNDNMCISYSVSSITVFLFYIYEFVMI